MVAARDKLAAFQSGSYTPTGNAERLGIAEWCKIKKLYHTAASLYATAFAADPKLADDLRAGAGHRYDAACFASLAAAGQGDDAAKLDDTKRSTPAATDPRLAEGRPGGLGQRSRLRPAPGSTGRRADSESLAEGPRPGRHPRRGSPGQTPADEQKAFTQLWADVAALLNKAQNPATKESKP